MKQVRTFQGQVNDKVFDNQKSMNAYIAECIENNTDITYTSSNTEVRYVTDEEAAKMNLIEREDHTGCAQDCHECSAFRRVQRQRLDKVPEPYQTPEEYLVPFLNEKIFTTDQKANAAQIQDTHQKIQRRLSYINGNKEAISQEHLDEPIVNALMKKYQWCSQRTTETNQVINNNNERIKRLQAEINLLQGSNIKNAAINKVYFDLGGYCQVAFNELTGEDITKFVNE